jgi:ParB-like chromosome segregation protein Spo0J
MGSFVVIHRSKIRKSPHNRRLERNEKVYKALIASMQSRGFDQAHPLRVRTVAPLAGVGEAFELIGGETRYDAGCEVGLDEFPCLVEELSDLDAMVELAADNEQTPFSPMEKALLLKDFRDAGGVIATVLPRFGLSEPEASKLAKALEVFEHAVANGCAGASLSGRQALLYEISRLPKDHWIEVARKAAAGEVTRAMLRERASNQEAASKSEGTPCIEDSPPPAAPEAAPDAKGGAEDAQACATVTAHVEARPPLRPSAPKRDQPPVSDRSSAVDTKPARRDRAAAPSRSEAIAGHRAFEAEHADADETITWVSEDELAEIYFFPNAPPGWGCAMVHGVPVFGPLKHAGGRADLSAAPSASGANPAAPAPAPPFFADIDALVRTLTSVAPSDDILEAVERVAPYAACTEIRVFELPKNVSDSFDLVFGAGAEWFRAVSARPHEEQRKAFTGMMLSFVPPEQVYHDEERPRLKSQPAAVVYGRISASASRQHVVLVAAVTLEDDGSGPTGIATTVIGRHVVQLPECRLHTDGGGAPSRLFAVAARRV